MSGLKGWTVDQNSFDNYIKDIKKFLSSEENFNRFRQPSVGYEAILEHVDVNGGIIYSKHLHDHYKTFLDKHLNECKQNDRVGTPKLYDFDYVGVMNPTTLRYTKFAADIFYKFGQLKNYNLIEIGAGYGGLSRILHSIFDFKSIKLVDLKEPLELQVKYLSKFNISCETYQPDEYFEVEENTLLVSNFSWCECDLETRNLYKENIISKCEKVFIATYNVDMAELTSLEGKQEIISDIYCQSLPIDIFTLTK